MNAELFKKIAPKAYYGKYLEENIRPDGRDMDEGRGVIISDAHINTANGSCFVRLGETGVICGIKLEVVNQKEAGVTYGGIDVSITLSPMSNPKFFLGKPTNQARYYSEILTRVFEKYVVDLEALYIPNIKKAIILHADLVVIDYEGCVLDACCLAFLGSLITLRIPSYSLKDDDIVIDYEHTQSMKLLETPISITFGLFDDFEVVDPDVMEEDLIDDSVTVILGMNNKTLSLIKPGGKPIPDSILTNIRDKARERYNELYTKLEEFKASVSS